MSTTTMLTLRITLDHSDPVIWRTIRVREDLPLTQLHDRIQGAMGWCDSHLHLFTIHDVTFLDHALWDDTFNSVDENVMSLADAKLAVGDTFKYLYDMGDNWKHTIIVEKRSKVDDDASESWVIDGANACPPEDIGGISGYTSMKDRTFDRTLFDIRSARRILWMLDHYGVGYPWQRE